MLVTLAPLTPPVRARKDRNMPFSEAIKKKVRQKAAFRCCRCQNIGVQVHHIIPEKYAGLDTIENAAPLCANCHTAFGDNPEKRKEITEMRDWWYEQVKIQFSSPDPSTDLLEEINSRLENLQTNHAEMKELKSVLKSVADQMIETITPANAPIAASGIVNASSAASSVVLGQNVHANFVCNRCGTRIGLLVGSDTCPNCGTKIQ